MIHQQSTQTRFFGGQSDDATPVWVTASDLGSVPGYSSYAQTFVATSPISAPVTFSVVDALPSGFLLSGNTITALLSNPPEGSTRTYNFTLRASTGDLKDDRPFTLVVTHAANSDPYADKVKFLYNLNGDYTDRSGQRNLVALNTGANAGVSTTEKKFGTHSLWFNGSSAGAVDIRIPASSDLLIPADTDYCFEFWMRASLPQSFGCMMITAATASGAGSTEIANSVNILNWTGASGSTASGTARTTLSAFIPGGQLWTTSNPNDSVWHHVAIVRQSGVTKLYFDGVAQGPSVTNSGTVDFGQQYGFLIGRYINFAINNIYIGYYDDMRLTVGAARYVANFTPPTTEFAFP